MNFPKETCSHEGTASEKFTQNVKYVQSLDFCTLFSNSEWRPPGDRAVFNVTKLKIVLCFHCYTSLCFAKCTCFYLQEINKWQKCILMNGIQTVMNELN